MIEGVIGQLIGAEGIDLALIGRPSTLAEDSVDRLTLESLSGDVAVLDWRSPEAIVGDLVAVGVDAERAAHPHDAEAGANVAVAIGSTSPTSPVSARRRVYAFDLANFGQPEEVIAALRALNQRRQVRTFTIGLGPQSTPAHVAGNGRRSGPNEGARGVAPEENVLPLAESKPGGRGAGPSGNGAEAGAANGDRSIAPADPQTVSDPSQRASNEGIDLDDLLDQLDQADP